MREVEMSRDHRHASDHEERKATKARVAVILAAGAGTRMRGDAKAPPKPVTRLLGLSLVERAMLALRAMGAARFIVVTGFEGARVAAHAMAVARRLGLNVVPVEAKDWEKGNGASALAAHGHVDPDEPFLLTMADHVLDPAMGEALMRAPLPAGTVRLAVDRDRGRLHDPADATKVRLATDEGGNALRIEAIGKDLPEWDAADTGLFLCTSAFFDALREAARQGRHGLTDAVRLLAREGRALAADVTGRDWIDADTPAALREAERRLMAKERGKAHDGPVARWLNRPLSRVLTRLLVDHDWATPNRITLLSFALALLAAWTMAQPGWLLLALGGLLAQASSVIDGVDGEIARLKLMKSDFGGWLDAVLDRYADGVLLFALAWHAAHDTGSAAAAGGAWLWGFAAIIGSFVNSYTADKYDGFMRRRLGEGAPQRLRMGRDVRVFLIMLGAVLDRPLLALAIIAVVMNTEVLRRIWLLHRADAAQRP